MGDFKGGGEEPDKVAEIWNFLINLNLNFLINNPEYTYYGKK